MFPSLRHVLLLILLVRSIVILSTLVHTWQLRQRHVTLEVRVRWRGESLCMCPCSGV